LATVASLWLKTAKSVSPSPRNTTIKTWALAASPTPSRGYSIYSPIIEDINTGPLQHFTISRIPIGDDAYDVVVSAGGLDVEVGDEENDDSEGMLQYDDVEEGAKEAQSSSNDNLPIWSLKKKQKKKNTS
jgi:hypothetical protein